MYVYFETFDLLYLASIPEPNSRSSIGKTFLWQISHSSKNFDSITLNSNFGWTNFLFIVSTPLHRCIISFPFRYFSSVDAIMYLSNILLLASGAAAAFLPTPTPTLAPREISTTASPTAAPTDIYFETTIFDTLPGVTNGHTTIAHKTLTLVLPTCSHTIIPDKNGHVPPGTCGALYQYYPSFAAAIVFSFIFGALSISHIFQAANFKTVSIKTAG